MASNKRRQKDIKDKIDQVGDILKKTERVGKQQEQRNKSGAFITEVNVKFDEKNGDTKICNKERKENKIEDGQPRTVDELLKEIDDLKERLDLYKIREDRFREKLWRIEEKYKRYDKEQAARINELEEQLQRQEHQTLKDNQNPPQEELNADLLAELDNIKTLLEGKVQQMEQVYDELEEVMQKSAFYKESYEKAVEQLENLQSQVEHLKESKRVTNARIRKLGGLVCRTVGVQTSKSTVNAATNTEPSSIYAVYGRSLKDEKGSDLFENFFRLQRDSFRWRKEESLPEMQATPDHQENGADRRNAVVGDQIMASGLDSVESFILNEAYFSAMELGSFEGEKLFEIAKCPTTHDTTSPTNRKIEVKLPSIPPGESPTDVKKKKTQRVEKKTSKVGLKVKEGNDTEWKPLSDHPCPDEELISPKKSASSPVLPASGLDPVLSELERIEKDALQRATARRRKSTQKQEFMLTPSK